MATVYIGNAVGDEHNHAYGGEPGDQTGSELKIQPWYKNKKGWRVFRPKSPEVASMLVYDMTAACENPHIGYENAAKVVKTAYLEGITLKEAAAKLNLMDPDTFDRLIRPETMV